MKMNYYITKKFIKESLPKYTLLEMSNKIGCSINTIYRRMRQYNIKKFKVSDILTNTFLIKEYLNNKKSQENIADEIGCTQAFITKKLQEYNIKARSQTEAISGDKNPHRIHPELSIGKNNPAWIDGRSYLPYTSEFTNKLKYRIRERDTFTCQNCGIIEKTHLKTYKRVLDIHHIDYNKENCKETNLITLCQKCNLYANINRDYWYAYYSYIIKEK